MVWLLIHIGVDTAELGGKFYTAHVAGRRCGQKGQTLITLIWISGSHYDVTTPLIVTNTDDYEEVKMLAEGTVNNGSEVLRQQMSSLTKVLVEEVRKIGRKRQQ